MISSFTASLQLLGVSSQVTVSLFLSCPFTTVSHFKRLKKKKKSLPVDFILYSPLKLPLFQVMAYDDSTTFNAKRSCVKFPELINWIHTTGLKAEFRPYIDFPDYLLTSTFKSGPCVISAFSLAETLFNLNKHFAMDSTIIQLQASSRATGMTDVLWMQTRIKAIKAIKLFKEFLRPT